MGSNVYIGVEMLGSKEDRADKRWGGERKLLGGLDEPVNTKTRCGALRKRGLKVSTRKRLFWDGKEEIDSGREITIF